MSSVESLRDFVCERLTAAAEEIFGVFKKTIVEYEEEINRQRRLLDIVWKPDIQLHRIELPPQHVCKAEEAEEEDIIADQGLCNPKRDSSLDQEDSEPPQIKEEQEEPCTSHEGEQLVLKLETDTFILTPTYEESDHSEPETTSDHELLSDSSHIAEREDQKRCKQGHLELGGDAETRLKERHHESISHSNEVYKPIWSESPCNTLSGKKSFKCVTCGRVFKFKYRLNEHMRIHTGEKPYSCDTCGKRFSRTSDLNIHTRTHTGERPFTCKTCGKNFKHRTGLVAHITVHTGEKPYSCELCGKSFRRGCELLVHMRRHTGEKPYSCEICGKGFPDSGGLSVHMRIHTGEKPYVCKTCGKGSIDISRLKRHMRVHKAEKP